MFLVKVEFPYFNGCIEVHIEADSAEDAERMALSAFANAHRAHAEEE